MREALACMLLLAGTGCDDRATSAVGAGTQGGIRYLAAGDMEGFASARSPRELVFPADHGSHPEFRTEWWYFTGNLFGRDERHFGFELTFFRIAIAPVLETRESNWATNQVWMAHFALTDTAASRFTAAERFAREALGLAGATATPFRVWVEDWQATGDASSEPIEIRVAARDGDTAIELDLVSTKPPVAHGDRGLDAKGPEPGNASFYYSLPRLEAAGAVTTGGIRTEVAGSAWMDREWSTSALSADLVGWDWFALQLDDGRDLMFYRLRRADGTASPFSSGSLIDPDGTRRALAVDDVELEALERWTSDRTAVTYPVTWRIRIPDEDLELRVEPRLAGQELALSVRYWEGAVRVTGRSRNVGIEGNGYVELAGY